VSDTGATSPLPQPPSATSAQYDFSPTELDRFFAATWKLANCEVCHSANRWVVGSPPKCSVIPSSDGVTFSTVSESVTIYLRVHCTNCGNTKFFLASAIRKWLTENP
jgi:hypothetical protein